METLPRGYGVAAEEPNERAEPRCTCGHTYDDHAEPEQNEYRDALETLCNVIGRIPYTKLPQEVFRAWDKATETLSVCQHKTCLCRKFVARNPHEDDRF